MSSRLRELENMIFFGDHSDEEWIKIDKEVDEELSKSSDEEIQNFMDSGAGDLLTQIIESIDLIPPVSNS